MDYKLSKVKRKEYDQTRSRSMRKYVCHAPLSSMYIGIGGMITSCCVNRTYLLGNYPENSLEESWFGERRMALAKAMKRGDLSKGCEVCYHSIVGGNTSGNSARAYDKFAEQRHKYPAKIDFELSNRCNLECIICRGERSSSIRKNREKLPPIQTPFDDAFIQELDPFLPHLKETQFLGGEPFLIPIYLDIWERMAAVNPSIHVRVQTNATILTDRVKKILESMRFSISISIDAVNKELYEEVRINGKFDTVSENIKYYQDYCLRKNTTLSISYTPMIRNWHELPDSVRFCNERGIRLFYNTLTHPSYLAIGKRPTEEIQRIYNFLSSKTFPVESQLEIENKAASDDFVRLVHHWLEMSSASAKATLPAYASMDEFFDSFRAYLKKEQVQNVNDMYVNVRGKIESLLTIAEDQLLYDEATNFILGLDFAKIQRYVPNASLEELRTGFMQEVDQSPRHQHG